jgi:hypothetical protein
MKEAIILTHLTIFSLIKPAERRGEKMYFRFFFLLDNFFLS